MTDIHIGLVFCAALLAYGILGGIVEYIVTKNRRGK